MSITRLQSGIPQALPAPVSAKHQNRRRSPHIGYTRGRYLTPRGTGISQAMFRIH